MTSWISEKTWLVLGIQFYPYLYCLSQIKRLFWLCQVESQVIKCRTQVRVVRLDNPEFISTPTASKVAVHRIWSQLCLLSTKCNNLAITTRFQICELQCPHSLHSHKRRGENNHNRQHFEKRLCHLKTVQRHFERLCNRL